MRLALQEDSPRRARAGRPCRPRSVWSEKQTSGRRASAPPLRRHLGDHGCKIAARGVPADRDPVGVHAESRRRSSRPSCGGERVLDRRRDICAPAPAGNPPRSPGMPTGCEHAAEPVMGVDVADDEAAAVEENQGRQWFSARGNRRVNARRDIAAGPGDRKIAHLPDRDVLRPDQAGTWQWTSRAP